ncbi:hypothetical protein GCM10022419_005270 [Nonomuraea rosea]|uniref:Uncharacterized protein n=1 Tax=Nonomuraea rosea TaxID=638574 RepID=A0ABP6V8G8_9ACTN
MTGRPAAFIALALESTARVADSEIAEILAEMRGRVDMCPWSHAVVTWAIGFRFDVPGIPPYDFAWSFRRMSASGSVQAVRRSG